MDIVSIVLSVLTGGAVSGIVTLYHAKSNKQTIDIGNMQQMLNEAHKMYDDSTKRYEEKVQEFDDYKATNMKYIAEFKARFAKLESRLDKAEDLGLRLKSAVFQGYRCKYPDNISDCPVIKEYEKIHCEECKTKEG